MKKRIGIIGSGVVAQTLARGFLRHGHDVMLGTQHAEKQALLRQQVAGATTGTFKEAAQYGEWVVLSVKGSAALTALKLVDEEALAGKIVMDTTNPIADSPPQHGVLQYFTSLNRSLMEQLQELRPQARLVKCFSCVGSAHMIDPQFSERPTMFICGNDANAKQEVTALLETVGWDVADMGGAEAARAIEPLAMLWCIPGFLHNRWNHAFRLLRK
ncbi:MAG: NAD(P)-binding domain-containing protein [Chitinophagales bacterium]|nr:NAD(P)-binding domain-containing protein [Chitinophagales bacterium]MDW8393916.1 NAD(P)-binding domain-containing protein [Chitinophagales bacterium]